jgi:catechol 2,3-dioxygenase-like lactoylglutathione lyase family enzyme
LRIERIDHLVLTVADVERTVSFYSEVLGMGVVTFGEGRRALAFGQQKINLHEAGWEIEPSPASRGRSAALTLIAGAGGFRHSIRPHAENRLRRARAHPAA